MARHIIADRVKEFTTTTGTGTVTLGGAVDGFRTFFAAIGVGNMTDYCLLSGNGVDWEVGIGTVAGGGLTVTRDVVCASSNGGATISLEGTSAIYTTASAARLRGKLVIVPEETGATAGTGNNTTAIEAWVAKIVATGLPGYIPPGIAYPCTSQMVWDLSGAATDGLVIDGGGIKRAVIDLTGVAASPALKIHGSGALFYHELGRFSIHGNTAGVLVQIGEDDYSDELNHFRFNLEIQNGSTDAAAVAVKINHVLDSQIRLIANGGGRHFGTSILSHRSIRNFVVGSAGNCKIALHFDDPAQGYSYGNRFHLDIEECETPVQCDTDKASRNSFSGGMVWENPGHANGACFIMNAGNNDFICEAMQPSRYDAGSIYPLAVGAKAAVVKSATDITGPFFFEGCSVAPRAADAVFEALIPSGYTGGVSLKLNNGTTNPARWRIVTTGDGSALNIERSDAGGAAIDNSISVDWTTGLTTIMDLALPVGGTFAAFGAVPATQPGAAGDPNPASAGAGATVLAEMDFTGGLGSTAYTIGDIVWALKTVGLIVS